MAVVAVEDIIRVLFDAGVETSSTLQFQPVGACPNAITPFCAVPPVPTFTLKAKVPVPADTDGEDPKPEEIVGADEYPTILVPILI